MKKNIERLKKIKKRYWVLLGILLAIILLIVLSKSQDSGPTTLIVERQDVADTIELAGNIDVDRRVDLGFATSGRVADVMVREGQTVKKGQTIARIDQNQLQASLIEAQANKVVTEVDTSSETDTVTTDLATIKRQQDALVKGAYDQYLSGDLQAYLADGSNRDLVAPTISGTYFGTQEGEYTIEMFRSSSTSGYSFRLSGLGSGTYTAEQFQPGRLGNDGLFILFDEATNYGTTKWVVPVPNKRSSSYATRKAAYENALATREQVISSAESQLNRVTGSSAQTTRSEAQVQRAQAQVNAVYAQLKDGRIVAPFDGIVARNDLEIGEIVSAFDPLVTIFGSNERELKLNVPEIYINKIETNDTVQITLDAYPDETFTGSVRTIDIIDTVVDGVPVYETVVVFDNEDPRIRVGMNAKAKVTSDSRADVIAIPQHYIIERDGSSFINLNKTGDMFEQEVELGFRGNDGLVEVISGLDEGDEIVRPTDLEDSK